MKTRIDRKFHYKHKWDGKTFSEDGYPISECGERLLPRDIRKIMSSVRYARYCPKKECYGHR